MRSSSPDLIRQPRQRPHRLISGRGDGRRKISPDTAARKISPNRTKRLWRGFHYVVSGTAMNVDINVGRDQSRLWKAMRRLNAFVVLRVKSFDTADAAVLN